MQSEAPGPLLRADKSALIMKEIHVSRFFDLPKWCVGSASLGLQHTLGKLL